MANAQVQGNTAQVSLPTATTVTVRAKTNSSLTQTVTVTSPDGTVNLQFTGTGEHSTPIGNATITGQSQVTATFAYTDASGNTIASKLNTGGPYTIGAYNQLLVVAENGDDTDYNDAIIEFSWTTPRS